MKTLLLVLIIASGAPVSRLSAQACKPADARSGRIIASLNSLMTGSSKDSLTRKSLRLPNVPVSEIAIVADSAVCARAMYVLDSVVHVTNPDAPAHIPPRPLYVLRIGSYLAVTDPGDRGYDHMIINFFDAAWTWLSNMSWKPGPDPS
jgi:hypothetical protein